MKNKVKNIEIRIEDCKRFIKGYIPMLSEIEMNLSTFSYAATLRSEHFNLGLYHLLKGEIELFKTNLSYSGMLHDYIQFHKIDDWISLPFLYSMFMSDNIFLYKRLNQTKNIRLWDDKGGWRGMHKATYELASKDFDGLKETLIYLKNIRGSYDKMFQNADVYFTIYQGFIFADELGYIDGSGSNIIFGVEQLEQEGCRKVRQKLIIEENWMSFSSTFFLKLAWLRGMEIKIDSDYVPKELLPFEPLEEYTIPYWFLRDYYKEQGVDWRYDPIHPELQP